MSERELPFVSVVVPVFNRKQWVQELIESLRRQTYPADRFEVILVDNGSTDGLWEWLQESTRDPSLRLRCFRNELPDKFPAVSRNVALGHARGEIIAFIDSDCWSVPGWLREGVAAFQDGIGVVVGKTIPDPADPHTVLFQTRTVLSDKCNFDTCNIFYRREAIDKAGGFGQDFITFCSKRTRQPGRLALELPYGEDIDLGYRVKRLGYRSTFAKEALVMHHIKPQTAWAWLTEPWGASTYPYIVKKHPEIRKELLWCRYFLSPVTGLFDVLLLGCCLAWLVHPGFLLLALPYLVAKVRQGGRHLSLAMRGVRLVAATCRALIIFAVLLYGSIRYRSLVI